MILEMRKEDAAILLRYFRWNKERLMEDYMDRPSKVLEAAGLGPQRGWAPSPRQSSRLHVRHLLRGRGGAPVLRHEVRSSVLRELLPPVPNAEDPRRGRGGTHTVPRRRLPPHYRRPVARPSCGARADRTLPRTAEQTYVEDRDTLKWCPAPDCKGAVDCPVRKKDLSRIVPTVACGCGHRFCFGCSLNDHQPAPCELVKRWLKKCADDSETANWISANTKECPRCNSTIEKNGGCNHMTCRKCKHEFCWMCMGLWSEHGTSWYSCNRFEEKSGIEARDAQAKSRVSLERYLHYYNRYANHEQSARLDKDIYQKTEVKMVQLQTASGMSWIEVQYLNSASQALQTCRQTLKWTYAFAFYLARNNLDRDLRGQPEGPRASRRGAVRNVRTAHGGAGGPQAEGRHHGQDVVLQQAAGDTTARHGRNLANGTLFWLSWWLASTRLT